MKVVNKIKCFVSNKILPITYSNSISYYELLEMSVSKINELVEAVNQLEPPDLQPIYDRLDSIETINESQQFDIDNLKIAVNNLDITVNNINITVNNINERVGTLESIATNHEQRISDLEAIVSYYMTPVNIENAMNNIQASEYTVEVGVIDNE